MPPSDSAMPAELVFHHGALHLGERRGPESALSAWLAMQHAVDRARRRNQPSALAVLARHHDAAKVAVLTMLLFVKLSLALRADLRHAFDVTRRQHPRRSLWCAVNEFQFGRAHRGLFSKRFTNSVSFAMSTAGSLHRVKWSAHCSTSTKFPQRRHRSSEIARTGPVGITPPHTSTRHTSQSFP